MKIFNNILALATVLALTACDEGRLYEDTTTESRRTGISATVNGKVDGAESWPEGYSLAIAGFETGNEYALISKNVEVADDGRVATVLSGIPVEVNTIELCAIDRLRRRVASFCSADYDAGADTLRLVANADVSMAGAIQSRIFNTTCTQCHGGASYAAAGLKLTSGNAFGELVGVNSVKEPSMLRVAPGQSGESVLYRILAHGESASWAYDHSVEVVAPEMLDLIKNWIDNGAKY